MNPTLTLHQSISIHAAPSLVFSTLIDLPAYNTWLCTSSAFKGTTSISTTPIRVGTTYIEHSPTGVRSGEVLELDKAERRVAFHQPMKLKPGWTGLVVDVRVDMVVKGEVMEGGGEGSRLEREVRLRLPVILRPFGGMVGGQFDGESWRTVKALKTFLEGSDKGNGMNE